MSDIPADLPKGFEPDKWFWFNRRPHDPASRHIDNRDMPIGYVGNCETAAFLRDGYWYTAYRPRA